GEVQRRKALLIALAWDDHIAAGGDPKHVPSGLIDKVGDLQHKAAVRPLVALFEQGDEATKKLVVEKGTALKQKEAFALIDRALQAGGDVRAAGVVAIRRMTSAPMLESLVRVFNSHDASDL